MEEEVRTSCPEGRVLKWTVRGRPCVNVSEGERRHDPSSQLQLYINHTDIHIILLLIIPALPARSSPPWPGPRPLRP